MRKRAADDALGNPDARISELYGLGSVSQDMLQAAGIHTLRDLEQLGPVPAYAAVIEAGCRPSLNLLWAIAGALRGEHWSKLPDDYRGTLLLEYDAWCDRNRHG